MNDFTLHVFSEDVDYSGVIYHTNYLKFIERARTTWLNQIESGLEKQKQLGVYYTIRSIDIKAVRKNNLDIWRPAVHEILLILMEKMRRIVRLCNDFFSLKSTKYYVQMDARCPSYFFSLPNYVKPARLDDELNVVTTLEKIGRTQLHFYQEIYNLTNENTLIITANVYVVCVNEQMRPVPIPSTILEAIPHDH